MKTVAGITTPAACRQSMLLLAGTRLF